MKPQIATTPEQGKRLIACGVDPKSADMAIRTIDEPFCDDAAWKTPKLLTLPYAEAKIIYEGDAVSPAWSLSALLAVLPKEIYAHDSDEAYYMSLAKEFPLSYEYGAAYIPCWFKGDALVRMRDDSPIEACVQLIEWLVAEKFKLNELIK